MRLTELDFRVSQAYYVNIPRQNLSTAFQARIQGLESDWRLVRFFAQSRRTTSDQEYKSKDYDVHDEGSTCSILRVKQVLGG